MRTNKLLVKKFGDCFNLSSASSEHAGSEGSEFLYNTELSDTEKAGCSKSREAESDDDSSQKCKMDIQWLFLLVNLQLLHFIKQVNRTSCCSTPDCPGTISIPNLLSLSPRKLRSTLSFAFDVQCYHLPLLNMIFENLLI